MSISSVSSVDGRGWASARRMAGMLLVVGLALTAYGAARRQRNPVDFEVMQRAGVRALAAQPLYRDEDGHFQYKYLPAYAFAMIPFSRIDLEISKALWFALSVGLLIVFVQQSVEELPGRRVSKRFLYWVTPLLIVKFVVTELTNGQCNILLGVLALAGFSAAQRGRARTAGALIGLAVFVKPYALVLLPWLALTMGMTSVAAFVVVVAAGLLMPVAVYGWAGNVALLAGWYHTVSSTTEPNLLLRHAISFAAMWAKWLGPGRLASELAIESIVAALAAAVLVWRRRTRVPDPGYLEVGFLLLLIPLLSPQGWDYVLLLGTPAMIVLVDRWTGMSVPWRMLTVAGFLMANFTTFDTVGQHLYMVVTTYAIVSVGAICLAASVVQTRVRGLA
jgi:Glycosyltransferase family 87